MPKAAVFYLSLNPGMDRAVVGVRDGNVLRTIYVRAAVVAGANDLMEALDQAKPKVDEVTMNSHYIDE
ncbi:MAG: hypothetical protein JW395_2591 [Nitrospira sp.]|nr:hypothetical protein [Nitrospira sp.]